MFWLQIIIPLVLALSGFLLLYVDKSREELFLMEYLNEVKTKLIDAEDNIPIAKIPVMLRSKYCNLTRFSDSPKALYCKYDPGCYFIIKGSEKVILALEKIVENKTMIF